MRRDRTAGIRILAVFGLLSFAAGCRSSSLVSHSIEPASDAVPAAPLRSSSSSVDLASYRSPAHEAPPDAHDDPFAAAELQVDRLVAEVIQRNPSMAAMAAAWQSAAQKYPQVVSLDDPMFGTTLGPATFGSSDVDFGWMVDGSQKIPWPGKRALRGEAARAEADAALYDIDDTRVRLAEVTRLAFLDYFLAHREEELNRENLRIMREFRDIAQTKYESNLVTQQDVLQAEVELAELARRGLELERARVVAQGRINTLLHRAPEHSLPPPAAMLDMPDGLPGSDALQHRALERRPDLAAQAARIRTEEAAVELACKEFYPDFEFVARYDSFWQPSERDLRPQVGVNLNLPLQRERRRAALADAVARLARQRAMLEQHTDQVRNDVHSALARLDESRRIEQLYTETILPAARNNVDAARAGYAAGRVDFLRLVEAQRQLIQLSEKHLHAVTDYHRRAAELDRAVGRPIDAPDPGGD